VIVQAWGGQGVFEFVEGEQGAHRVNVATTVHWATRNRGLGAGLICGTMSELMVAYPMKILRLLLGIGILHTALAAQSKVLTDVAFLSPDRQEKMDVYLPATAKAGAPLAPAVVWIHGGGWKGGTKAEARAKNICSTLAAAGYVAVSIDYRLGAGRGRRICRTAKTRCGFCGRTRLSIGSIRIGLRWPVVRRAVTSR